MVAISVFFPCYNEQQNVGRTVEKAREVLDKIGADFEIIIVNDGSTDETGHIADELAGRDSRIKVVHHRRNLGYGAALQSGFRAATKELVFYTDGDGQFDINEMPPLLPLMEEYDIVSCYRLNRRDSMIRKINAWCWTKLVCLLFGLKLRDIDCAFKLYKREIFDHIQLTSTGALIDAEILARAACKGYRITQQGVQHYPRMAGSQTGAKFRVISRAFKELFELRRRIRNAR
jgi:glycosyltransferase involved in cell wall biosynthesis